MMDGEKIKKLISDVKSKLKITWDNEAVKKELADMAADAELYLNHLFGAEIDYSASGMFHRLFLEYCLYERNNCANEFEEAYKKDILRCQAFTMVQQMRGEESNESSSNETQPE